MTSYDVFGIYEAFMICVFVVIFLTLMVLCVYVIPRFPFVSKGFLPIAFLRRSVRWGSALGQPIERGTGESRLEESHFGRDRFEGPPALRLRVFFSVFSC